MHGPLAMLLISVVAAGLFTAVAWRWSRVGVRSDGGVLIVRNFASTQLARLRVWLAGAMG